MSARVELTALLQEHFEAAALWYLESAEFGEELTDDECDIVELFERMAETLDGVSPRLLKSVDVGRAVFGDERFPTVLSETIRNVGDTFQPKDVSDFLRRLDRRLAAEAVI